MLCVPGSRLDQLSLAWPQLAPPPGDRLALPSRNPPSLKATVPVGGAGEPVLGGAGHTVSVKAIVWPKNDGPDDDRVVVTGALFTVWVKWAVAGVKLASPL